MFRFLRDRAGRWLILLAGSELLLLMLALHLGMHVRYWGSPEGFEQSSHHLMVRALVFAAVQVCALASLGLYQPRLRESWSGLLARQVVGFILGGTGVALLYYAVPQFYVGRGVLALALLIALPLLLVFRRLFMRLIDVETLKRRVLIMGAGQRAAMVMERMRRQVDRRGFHVVGFMQMGAEIVTVPQHLLIGNGGSLLDYAREQRVDEIVYGPDDRRDGVPMEALLDCKQRGIAVTDLATFFERELGKIKMGVTEPSWLVFSPGFNASRPRRMVKRGFDLLCAALVLVLAWPLMLMTALAIRLDSPRGAPVLYRQERVGENGRPFDLFKFRSMRTDAEQDGVARWASKEDARVTRVGKFTRKTRLDELPQVWNVLRGDMSFIGPRPERPQFVDQLSRKIRYYPLRHCLKPGLTGWAQLNYPYGSSEEDAAEKLKYDLFYVKNQTLLLDVLILLQTVEIVLFGRGAR